MHKPACARPVFIPPPPPQYIFYSTFVHCEIVVCCPIICADLRGSSRHSYLRPHPQRSTGGHVRSLVGRHHKETRPALLPSHFGRACSDSTYAEHHLLRPLLTTVLIVKKQNIKTVRRCVENAQAKTKNEKEQETVAMVGRRDRESLGRKSAAVENW